MNKIKKRVIKKESVKNNNDNILPQFRLTLFDSLEYFS